MLRTGWRRVRTQQFRDELDRVRAHMQRIQPRQIPRGYFRRTAHL
jgi:hypothetical protein